MAPPRIRNMEEFAAVSGLSRPTVSKYFHDPESVRPSTRARIQAALERYAFEPNIYAVNQNRQTTKNVGVVVPYLADPFFGEIARKIETLVIAAGFRPILLSSHGDREQEAGNLATLRAIRPAGVLLAPLGRLTDRSAVEAFAAAVPTVLFDSNLEELGHAYIGSNNHQSIALMVEHLAAGGAPPALFEMRMPTNPNALTRRAAYTQAMERLGHTPHLLQAEGDGWDFEAIGFAEGGRMMEAGLPTDAVLCSNDRLAIGFLAAAYRLGKAVGPGRGLRVAGHDDHPFARYTCPSLTTVAQNYTAIAETALATLLDIIEAGSPPPAPSARQFPGLLIVRNSG